MVDESVSIPAMKVGDTRKLSAGQDVSANISSVTAENEMRSLHTQRSLALGLVPKLVTSRNISVKSCAAETFHEAKHQIEWVAP
jgi:hypothetical protein